MCKKAALFMKERVVVVKWKPVSMIGWPLKYEAHFKVDLWNKVIYFWLMINSGWLAKIFPTEKKQRKKTYTRLTSPSVYVLVGNKLVY